MSDIVLSMQSGERKLEKIIQSICKVLDIEKGNENEKENNKENR